jgi:hypothetical protein
MTKFKKILKITLGALILLTLPSLLFIGYLFIKYDEELPHGIEGEPAEIVAVNMLDALDYEAYQKTNYIEWTYRNKHHYKWEKAKKTCAVYWKEYKVVLNFNAIESSKAYVHNFAVSTEQREALVAKALSYFYNDSFWLVAPYKIYDRGAERRLVTLDNGNKALLVTYTSGGETPGDSYLWLLDASGKPVSFKMWASVIPFKGLEFSWSDWTTTESGAQLPTAHRYFFFGLDMGEVKGTR